MGKLRMNFSHYEAFLGQEKLELTPKEFELLKLFVINAGKLFTREQLLEKIWGYEKSMEIDTNTVDQHIARLRAKLGAEAARIVTVKNVGYRIKTD